MRVFAVDTETHLIRPGKNAPELVCVTIATCPPERVAHFVRTGEGAERWIFDRDRGIEVYRDLLRQPDTLIVGQNFAFDSGVFGAADSGLLPAIFDAYAADRIADTMIREKLLNLSRGELKQGNLIVNGATLTGYSLARIVWNRFRVDRTAVKGADAWRTRYHELDGVPLDEWPIEAVDYAQDDATDTLRAYYSQQFEGNPTLCDEFRQTRKAFGLRLAEAHGLRTDLQAVEEAADHFKKVTIEADGGLIAAGLMRRDGSMNQAALRERIAADFASRGLAAPTTPIKAKDGGTRSGGAVKLDVDTLRECHDPALRLLVTSQEARDFLSDWLPLLMRGTERPIHASYDSLQENARTSTRPNVQNFPRKGVVRSCFVPRAGFDYCSNDFNQVEACAFAQACLWTVGRSDMADAIRNGQDIHSRIGSRIMGIPYADFVRRRKAGDPDCVNIRQTSKPVNFGYMGGMGPAKMAAAVWKQAKIRISEAQARMYRGAWLREWSEAGAYFEHVNGLIGGRNGTTTIRQFGSGRVRGNVTFTETCNGFFSAIANDGAGDAVFQVSREMYAVPASPLFGSRIAVFPHDEIVAEVPREIGHEAGYRLSAVMNATMQRWIPDIPISSEPALMRRYYKGAETVKDANGRLTIWEPDAKH
jgi:DNA polymerase-1